MELLPGAYETIINAAIKERLNTIEPENTYIAKEDIDSSSSNNWLANYLANVVSTLLCEKFKDEKREKTICEQVDCINAILRYIEKEWEFNTQEELIEDSSQFLRGIYNKIGLEDKQIQEKSKIHPMSGYRTSSLFTGGGKEVAVGSEICMDIKTADKIDLLVSFIKFRGWRLIADDLTAFVKRPGTKLRILTTTYMGATDSKALRAIYDLKRYGDVEIKVSFNSDQDRLHAKVYGFYRNSGTDTAYIGSSNLSKEAITTGMEWNMRITQAENPHIIEKMKATFEQYWTGEEFEPIESDADIERFQEAITRLRNPDKYFTTDDINAPDYVSRFIRKNHQIRVLDQIKFEREVKGSFKNLIVAATGTGKTAISAFDFKDFRHEFLKREHREPNLLFVVHREKILKQARYTFRSVLVDGYFGKLWVGSHKPDQDFSHLFVSIQTFNSNKAVFEKLGKDYYDYIVIDEAHHSQADSYRILFTLFTPKILLGLTATPERMDGKSLLPDFNNRIAAEIRLPEALNQGLLCPFDYYCITDESVDLSKIKCSGGKYDVNDLTAVYEKNKIQRFAYIQQALHNYINDPHDCKAVCFCCSVEQAESMAEMLNNAGYNALAVTSKSSHYSTKEDIVDNAASKLAKGEINYLCVADMLNEGIDIPEIDVVLFLRPTESLTIFLQQLGRGLRLADNKNSLTVLDFIAQAHKNYNYESRFRALMGKTNARTSDQIKKGFPFLPAGCTIKMEAVAQEYILQNLQDAVFDLKRLKQEVMHFKENFERELTLPNFLDQFCLDWRQIYKSPGSWSYLKQLAGINMPGYNRTREVENIENGLARLYHVNSYSFLRFIQNLIINEFSYSDSDEKNELFAKMFYYSVLYWEPRKYEEKFGPKFNSIRDGIKHLSKFPYFREELEVLIEMRMGVLHQTTVWLDSIGKHGIELYGCYSADEVHIICEDQLKRGIPLGTQYIKKDKLSLVFVTTNKSDKDYSPTTLYKDYAINEHQFHWQSKNDIRIESEAGQRFIQQKENGWRFLLFVRESKNDEFGNTNGYHCLGLMEFNKSEGECPMNITWDMQNNIPGFILQNTQAI